MRVHGFVFFFCLHSFSCVDTSRDFFCSFWVAAGFFSFFVVGKCRLAPSVGCQACLKKIA